MPTSLANDEQSPSRTSLQRQLRLGRRYLSYLTSRELYPRCARVPTIWVEARPNFGDDMTPQVLAHLGIAAESCAPADAQLVAIGSLLEMTPDDYSGYVWGTGQMSDRPMDRPNFRPTVLAVRGALTRDHLGLPATTPLGDPGLFARELVPRPTPTVDIAVIPHYSHRGSSWVRRLVAEATSGRRSVKVIDVRESPSSVIYHIGTARHVITSSLHGLIVADSLGIPAVWGTPAPAIGGHGFKFLDHESAVRPNAPLRRVDLESGSLESLLALTQTVDVVVIDKILEQLRRSLEPLLADPAIQRRSPLALPALRLRSMMRRRAPSDLAVDA